MLHYHRKIYSRHIPLDEIYNGLVGEVKRTCGRPRHRWEFKITLDLRQ